MSKDVAREQLKYIIRKQKSVTTSRLEDLLQEIGFYTKQGETFEEKRLHKELQSMKQSRDAAKRKAIKLEKKIAGLYRRLEG